MKSIYHIFKGNEHLMDLHPVEELIDYCQELEGKVFETDIEKTYDKELILLEMIRDIYNSCRDTQQNNELNQRYPDLYPKVDSDDLVNNLKNYIGEMCRINNIDIWNK